MDALRASAFVPGWSDHKTSIPFLGAPAFDGIFSQILPCPANVTFCIKISGLPPFDTSRQLEGLKDWNETLATLQEAAGATGRLVGSNLVSSIATMLKRNTIGNLDAAAWSKVMKKFQSPFADFYPGKWSRWVVLLLGGCRGWGV